MMKHSVEIKLKFRSGHRLIPPYVGKCNNIHGEGFTAIIFLSSKILNKCGMVVDFGTIKKQIKEWIDNYLDHAYIHHDKDEMGKILRDRGMKVYNIGVNPTSENIAKLIFDKFKLELPSGVYISKVGIVESFEDSIAWYERGEDEDS